MESWGTRRARENELGILSYSIGFLVKVLRIQQGQKHTYKYILHSNDKIFWLYSNGSFTPGTSVERVLSRLARRTELGTTGGKISDEMKNAQATEIKLPVQRNLLPPFFLAMPVFMRARVEI